MVVHTFFSPVKSRDTWATLASAHQLEKIWLNPSLTEIYDLQWSPDSLHIAVGAIDCKAEIIRLSTKATTALPGHTSYVQGIAWDPFNKMVVTQSADRTCRVHHVRYSSHGGAAPKLYTKSTSAIKQQISPLPGNDIDTPSVSTPEKAIPSIDPNLSVPRGKNLFADSTVPCFFR